MSILQQIEKGKTPRPPRVLFYGVEGVGKSSTAAKAPNAIFIATEDGLDQISCDKFPLARSLDHVMASLQALLTEKHDYGTVVIDSLDCLERLVHDDICREYHVSSIELAAGGYGKGYVLAIQYWRRILEALSRLRDERGMAIILIAHSKVEKFEDPTSVVYDRYSPRLHKHISALVTEWVDAVLFATYKFRTETQEQGFGHKRTIAKELGSDGGERILRTVGSPACLAKNRFGLPAEMPLSWDALFPFLKSA